MIPFTSIKLFTIGKDRLVEKIPELFGARPVASF